MANLSRPKQSVHGQWSSRLGFILATTGAAVGLGNIWKFPYMAGDNGGSAFVLVYLACVVIIGLPVMIAEMLLGRRGRQNPVNSMALLASEARRNPGWQFIGWWGAAILLLVLSFYSVVAGWSLAYIMKSITGTFTGMNASLVQQQWTGFLSTPWPMLLWNSIFMWMTLWVVARGVQGGLEKASRIMMPALFGILIILVGYATSTTGFIPAVHFLFDVNFSKITADVVIAAMGHAFFTLAIGAGCMLVYGAYLPNNTRLASTVVIIAGLDVLVALLAGLAIFPIVFTHHLSPQGGPGLMFEILPIAFAKMGGGAFFGSLFFLLLLFAAWTSSISLAEPLVILLMERANLKRKTASFIVGITAWTMGIASILSFNVWQHVKLLGHWNIFAIITDLATNIMLPVGGFLIAIFAGWFMLKPTAKELSIKRRWIFSTWLFLVRFIAPIGILIIIISTL